MADAQPDYGAEIEALFGGKPSVQAPAPSAPSAPSASSASSADDIDAVFGQGSKSVEPSAMTTAVAPFVGFNRGLANVVGAPVDFANWALDKSLGSRGFKASLEPFGGSESIKRALGVIRANPDTASPRSGAEQLLQGFGQGVAGAMVPELGMAGLGRSGVAALAPRTYEAVSSVTGNAASGAASATNALIGGGGAVGGELAADAAPQPLKPLAGLAGGLAGGLGSGLVAVGARGLGAAIPKGREYLAPLTKSGQESIAARDLASGLESPMRVADVLDNEPGSAVPGSKLTLFQRTGDMGAGQLERQSETLNAAPWLNLRAENNKARVNSLNQIGGEGSPGAVSKMFNDRLADFDKGTEAQIQAATTDAANAASKIGGNLNPEEYGAQIRANVQDIYNSRLAERNKLYAAVDPDGKLNVVTTGPREVAERIQSSIDPRFTDASAFSAPALEKATAFSDVTPFRDLMNFDSYLSGKMSEASRAGDNIGHAQLVQLKGSVKDAINNAVENQHAWEQAAVARGEIHPDATIHSRLEDTWDDPSGGQGLSGRSTLVGAVQSGSSPAGAGSTGVSGNSGTARPQGYSRSFENAEIAGNSNFPRPGEFAPEFHNPPPDLIQWIIDNGGIKNDRGDLKNMLGRQGGRPGLINNRTGMRPDEAARAAAEAGYFGGDTTSAMEHSSINDLYDAMQGAPRYSVFDQHHLEQYSGFTQARERMSAIADAERAVKARAGDLGFPDELVKPAAKLMIEDGLSLDHAMESAAIRSVERDAEREYAARFDKENPFPGDLPSRPMRSRPVLTPNMDESASSRLKTANAEHANIAQTYRNGPIKDILKTNGYARQYTAPDAAVVGKFFPAGNKGFEAAQSFRKAVGDDDSAISIMRDFIASSMRRAAQNPDGTIDLKKFAVWKNSHQDALRAFPELSPGFETAVKSSQTVADLATSARASRDAMQSGIVANLLKVSEPADVTKVIGGIFGKQNSSALMKDLAAKVNIDSDAKAGFRRAVADYIVGRFISNTEAGTSGVNLMKSDQFQTFLKTNRNALAHVFTPEELNSMSAIATDLHAANRSISSNKLPGRSNTAQDILPRLEELGKPKLSNMAELLGMVGAGYAEYGVPGAVVGGVGAAGHSIIRAMRDAGFQKSRDLITEALMNPELARELLKKAPYRPNVGSHVSLARQIGNQIVYNGAKQAFGNSEIENSAPDLTIHGRPQRASGGRVRKSHTELVNRLVKFADLAKKHTNATTETLLNVPDAAIARALEISKSVI